jgi:hypothetical protein
MEGKNADEVVEQLKAGVKKAVENTDQTNAACKEREELQKRKQEEREELQKPAEVGGVGDGEASKNAAEGAGDDAADAADATSIGRLQREFATYLIEAMSGSDAAGLAALLRLFSPHDRDVRCRVEDFRISGGGDPGERSYGGFSVYFEADDTVGFGTNKHWLTVGENALHMAVDLRAGPQCVRLLLDAGCSEEHRGSGKCGNHSHRPCDRPGGGALLAAAKALPPPDEVDLYRTWLATHGSSRRHAHFEAAVREALRRAEDSARTGRVQQVSGVGASGVDGGGEAKEEECRFGALRAEPPSHSPPPRRLPPHTRDDYILSLSRYYATHNPSILDQQEASPSKGWRRTLETAIEKGTVRQLLRKIETRYGYRLRLVRVLVRPADEN